MKKLEAVGIGVAVGLIYGVILWFIRQQITWIYTQAYQQGATVTKYYSADDVAFYTAVCSVLVSFTIIFLYQYIYNRFEKFAINNSKFITGEKNEKEIDHEDEFYNGEEVDQV